MAIKAITSAQVIVETSDISAWTGQISDQPGAITVREVPTFGNGGFMPRVTGQKSGKWSLAGYADHGATGVSTLLTPAMLGTQLGVSVAVPSSGFTVATGDWAQFGTGKLTAYSSMQATPDSPMPFMVDMETDAGFVVSGRVGAPLGSRTSTGYTGAAVALTGPAAGKSMWAILHVTAAAGTNCAVKVQSDDNGSFTTPTDRITFSTVSAVSRQSGSVAGSLATETHWRVLATIASGTFSFACYFGVA